MRIEQQVTTKRGWVARLCANQDARQHPQALARLTGLGFIHPKGKETTCATPTATEKQGHTFVLVDATKMRRNQEPKFARKQT